MNPIQVVLIDILRLLGLAILVQVVLSWIPPGTYSSVSRLNMMLSRFTEPVLRPIRRLMPRVGAGAMQFDLSPLVALVLINFILIPIVAR
ncbi:MAG: YggT family protein [Acidimicrobiaceae bacterium]|nr:YggT family protein [Acidimicrobiaceae bacterium]